MYKHSTAQNIYFVLRLAVAMCFIGHGAFGIITKPVWANYFAVFGIGHTTAYMLMPWLGCADIALGIIMLVYPIRAVAGWLVVWGLVTASLRPLSGEPFAELVERAGNFGAPLCLLIIVGFPHSFKEWFKPIKPHFTITAETIATLKKTLYILVFLLLAGHGWLNLIHKKGLIDQYARLGFIDPVGVSTTAGLCELFAAFTILVKPAKSILLLLLVWKVGTELFYPHWEVFEWVERGGSYGCILALIMVLQFQTKSIFKFMPSFTKLNFNQPKL